jgi:metallo-beta-lactamase family protein
MKLTFCGGAGTVSGSCYLLETKKTKLLVDCGMFQGEGFSEKNKEPFLFNPEEIQYVFLTHAHLDHSGLVPKLVKEGFKGKIISTPPTKDFYPIMLFDAQNIFSQGVEDKDSLLYSKKDIEDSIPLFEEVEYEQKVSLNEEISFILRDAGHILGSSIIEMWVKDGKDEKKIVFSGDLGNSPVPLLRPLETVDSADYVLIESTYGDSIHEDAKKRKYFLEDIIEETVSRGGVLMIPSFALERTQELLYELNDLFMHGRIPKIPVFIDSPMAIEMMDVYKKHSKYFNKETKYLMNSGDDIFHFPNLVLCEEVEQSREISNVPAPKIIIAGSGMSQGGRILSHERRYLPDQNNTLLLVCYQVKGTMGRELQDGAKEVEIFNEKVSVFAQIKTIKGYSAHADQEGLLRWLKKIKKENPIKKVFAVQGEKGPADALVLKIRDTLALDASAPNIGDKVEL